MPPPPPPPAGHAAAAFRNRTSIADPLAVKVRCSGSVHDREGAADGEDVVYAGLKKTDAALAVSVLFRPEAGGLLRLTDDDVFFDLGCGHGDVLLAARKVAPRCRCIGVELDAQCVEIARAAVEASGADGAEPIEVAHCSLDQCLCPEPGEGEASALEGVPRLEDATVVFMYIGQWAMLKLRPKILRTLREGTRIVSRSFTFGEAWPPDAEASGFGDIENTKFMLFTVTAERKADPALLSADDVAKHYGSHWVQPPPTAYNPIAVTN